MHIQIDISEEVMKQLALYKINNNLKSKSKAIVKILDEYFKKQNVQ